MHIRSPLQARKSRAVNAFKRFLKTQAHKDALSRLQGTARRHPKLGGHSIQFDDGDAIVVISLKKKLFCCQAELRGMNRERLFKTAQELNKHLPDALKIVLTPISTHRELLNDIERTMGFRRHTRRDHYPDPSSIPDIPLLSKLTCADPAMKRRAVYFGVPSAPVSGQQGRRLDVVREDDMEMDFSQKPGKFMRSYGDTPTRIKRSQSEATETIAAIVSLTIPDRSTSCGNMMF